MTDRLAPLPWHITVGVLLFLSCLCVTDDAAADDAHTIFFNEGVLGANEAGFNLRPLLLASPELKLSFYLKEELHLSQTEKTVLRKTASFLAGSIGLSARLLEVTGVLFSLEAHKEVRPFIPAQISPNELAVVFADAEKHHAAIQEVLDAAYRSLSQRHSGLGVKVDTMFRCGLFLFHTPQEAIAAILFVVPDEEFATASYCVNFAVLQTAGFRGLVTSLPEEDCKSVRCAEQPLTYIATWDAMALAALYSVQDPQALSALYRFKEIVKAAPAYYQSGQ